MSQSDDNENFAALLQALAANLVLSQLRLDREYEQQLKEFVALLAQRPEWQPLAQQFVPAAMAVDNTTLTLAVNWERAQSQETTLGVKLLNLGAQQKYRYSEFTSSQLQITVQRIPFAPEGRPRP